MLQPYMWLVTTVPHGVVTSNMLPFSLDSCFFITICCSFDCLSFSLYILSYHQLIKFFLSQVFSDSLGSPELGSKMSYFAVTFLACPCQIWGASRLGTCWMSRWLVRAKEERPWLWQCYEWHFQIIECFEINMIDSVFNKTKWGLLYEIKWKSKILEAGRGDIK